MYALAKLHRPLSRMSKQFDLFANRAELRSAYMESNNLEVYRDRSKVSRNDVQPGDDEAMVHGENFRMAFEYGLPRTAGGMTFWPRPLIMHIAGGAVPYDDWAHSNNFTQQRPKNKKEKRWSNVFRQHQRDGSPFEPLAPLSKKWEETRKKLMTGNQSSTNRDVLPKAKQKGTHKPLPTT